MGESEERVGAARGRYFRGRKFLLGGLGEGCRVALMFTWFCGNVRGDDGAACLICGKAYKSAKNLLGRHLRLEWGILCGDGLYNRFLGGGIREGDDEIGGMFVGKWLDNK